MGQDKPPVIAGDEFVRQWTRIVLILAVTLATLYGVPTTGLL